MSERKDFPPKFNRKDALWLGGLLLVVVLGILLTWLA